MEQISASGVVGEVRERAASLEKSLDAARVTPPVLLLDLTKRLRDVGLWLSSPRDRTAWSLIEMAALAVAGAMRIGSSAADLEALSKRVWESSKEPASVDAALEGLLTEMALLAEEAENTDSTRFVQSLEALAAAVVRLTASDRA